jgi:hypothetical protein
MTARITPEPTDAQRQAILAAVARSPRPHGGSAYLSAWRVAALRAVGESGLAGPGLADPRKDPGA